MTATTEVSVQERSGALSNVLSSIPTGLLIGGAERAAGDGSTMSVENPATGAPLLEIADAGLPDGLAAVNAAVAAQQSWAATSPRRRADILRRAADLLLARSEDFALVMTAEMGKPLAEARGEVGYAAEILRWFSEQAAHITGSYGLTADGATRMLVSRRPVGPCLLITPWNFPLAMGARKIAPAIATGCTMVFKPAPQTPLTSLALARLLVEAGLPDGVLNVVTTTRAEVITQPMIGTGALRKLSFTGSTEVGRILLGYAADTVMRTSMELGGNAPLIVFDDADLDVAVDAAFAAKMRNMGEACTAANRMFVHDAIAAEFTEALTARMTKLVVGDGMDPATQVGPLIDQASLNKVDRLVEDAVQHGAAIVGRGSVPGGAGYFCAPTVLSDVPRRSLLSRTEVFGPVAAISTFTDEASVIAAANDTEWGLVGYVVTENLDRALRVSDALEVGMVGINTGVVSNPSAPFGGVKQSGLGREGGAVGIEEYLEFRYTAIPVR
jgi:succinate-semialdehyde dehydrogenase/glutarate-semialdehyde dehydrogenase